MILKHSGLLLSLSRELLIFCSCILFLCGCRQGHYGFNKSESAAIDSLIRVTKLNDRVIVVSFGYDAVSAIKTGKGIVVIDAGISTELTSKYRKIIQDKFNCNEFVYVINTHGHHDHLRGNSVFSEAQIAGHANCPEEISAWQASNGKTVPELKDLVEDYERQLEYAARRTPEWNDLFTQRMRYLGALNDARNNIPVNEPGIIFSDSLNLCCGDVKFEMMYFGCFHSKSDIVIYVPAERLLFTGDLFSEYGRPSLSSTMMTDPGKWKQGITWIEKRMPAVDSVIGGHGDILSLDDLENFIVKITGMHTP